MESKYVPYDSLVPGKWYAIHCDPAVLNMAPKLRTDETVLLRCAVAGPFESEIEAADWFDENPQFGAEHALIRQVPVASP